MTISRREMLLGAAAPADSLPRQWMLAHEHVMVDFIGADKIAPGRYDPEDVIRAARPKLEEIVRLGCRRLVECTPNYLGRDPRLLRRLAKLCGIDLWTNTGLYGAAQHKYLPRYAFQESAGQLAKRWTHELKKGVDGVKPRFIKIGVDRAPLGDINRKLVEAAGLTTLETGAPIACHTGNGPAALEQMEILTRMRVPLAKWIWVHAQNERDPAVHRQVAQAGGWVEFDGISPNSADRHLELVRHLASAQLLGRVLISQDSGWYHVGEPGGGNYRGYAYLYTDFLPRLDAGWRDQLVWENPRRAFLA